MIIKDIKDIGLIKKRIEIVLDYIETEKGYIFSTDTENITNLLHYNNKLKYKVGDMVYVRTYLSDSDRNSLRKEKGALKNGMVKCIIRKIIQNSNRPYLVDIAYSEKTLSHSNSPISTGGGRYSENSIRLYEQLI